jgi:hypothetical protein
MLLLILNLIHSVSERIPKVWIYLTLRAHHSRLYGFFGTLWINFFVRMI